MYVYLVKDSFSIKQYKIIQFYSLLPPNKGGDNVIVSVWGVFIRLLVKYLMNQLVYLK